MKNIIRELKHHAPFTAFGAVTGIVLMFLFKDVSHGTAHRLFYVFHPLHVFLSAVVTVSIYKLHQCDKKGSACSIFVLIMVGYFGSIGVATISDSLIPHIGERLLNLPHAKAHIGFIEEWPLISLAALLGIVIAYFKPRTKIPHAGHVLISTWASLFHVMMAVGDKVAITEYLCILLFLFISVWLPCCVSDIIFPLLFVNKKHEH